MNNKEDSSEEIDLGQLFSLISKGINGIGNVIKNIFKNAFDMLVKMLVFIQKHFIKFVISGIVGACIGVYLDFNSRPIYQSSMIVSPNFNSAQQLYNNIEFYNELAKEQEYKNLGRALSIKPKDAESIREMTVESFTDEAQKIKQFSEFISSLDTLSQQKVDYDAYLKNYNDINSKYHRVTFKATSASIAKKCQNSIIESINNNNHFKIQKEINLKNLKLEDSIIKYQLNEIKSLQKFDKEIKRLKANKETASTSINLGRESSSSDKENLEIELLKKIDELKEELIELKIEEGNTKNTINVISDFPSRGVKVSVLYKKKTFILGVLGIVLMLIFLILRDVNKFLKNYNKSL